MNLPPWTAVALAAGLSLAVVLLWSRWRRFDRTRAATVYLRGFQYLLSDDPDGAIEVLTKVASTGTLEAYFTLGSLYRRKGELERALQLHRNLLLSPELAPSARRQALGELGRDYRQGALWSEAAEALEQACEVETGDPSPVDLREELRDVYLAAGRFADAAARQRTVGRAGADRLGAHLWAEASAVRLAAGDRAGARAAAAAAREAAPAVAHGLAALAAVRAAEGDLAAAREAALEAAADEPWTGGIVFPWLREAHAGGGQPELLAELEAWLPAHPEAVHALLLRAQLLRSVGRQAEAASALRQLLGRAPGFLEARAELGRIVLAAGLEGELRQAYQELLANLSADTAVGRCVFCGQPSREVRWRCPACARWDWLEPAPTKDLTQGSPPRSLRS
ncbi:MAG: hypothetical protein ACYDCL_11130 [Myxococcales bacterium]